MHIIEEQDQFGRHVIAFQHLGKMRKNVHQQRTWRYIDDNSDYFALHELPTDQQLKSIFAAADNGVFTREKTSMIIAEMYRDQTLAINELNEMLDLYHVVAFTRDYSNSIASRFIYTYGFSIDTCVNRLAYDWQKITKWIDGETEKPNDYFVSAYNITQDIDSNFAHHTAILHYCDERTKSGKIKFPESQRRMFQNAAIVKVYKNGSFEVQYTEPMHRLYLTAMRFNERVGKIRASLEAQDKLAGILEGYSTSASW